MVSRDTVPNKSPADTHVSLYSIVSPEKKIVGIGYNGFPNGCDDDSLPWARTSESGSPLDTKYPVRVFAGWILLSYAVSNAAGVISLSATQR